MSLWGSFSELPIAHLPCHLEKFELAIAHGNYLALPD
jgi:hypothetical protein